MPDALVQILKPDGTLAKKAEKPSISAQDQVRLYRAMLLNRRVDERMITLQRQGRIGFYIGSIGEEAAIVGSAFAMAETDWIVPCYRELGAALLRGYSLHELFCQLFGNAADAIKGRQMPNHYALPHLRFASISSPVGTQIPQATGMAWAAKISGKKDVVLCYFGDGATSEGDFHVGLNFSGVFKAPVVFLCRNNQWAISVPFSSQTASKNVAIKGQAYGLPAVRVDGNDIFGVIEVTREAAAKAREGGGPTLVEAVTYRLAGHSTSDDPRAYRDEAEVASWANRDPIQRFKTWLVGQGVWSQEQDARLEEEIKTEIQVNLRKAESVGPPPTASLFEDVFDEIPWHLKEQAEELRKSERAQAASWIDQDAGVGQEV